MPKYKRLQAIAVLYAAFLLIFSILQAVVPALTLLTLRSFRNLAVAFLWDLLVCSPRADQGF